MLRPVFRPVLRPVCPPPHEHACRSLVSMQRTYLQYPRRSRHPASLTVPTAKAITLCDLETVPWDLGQCLEKQTSKKERRNPLLLFSQPPYGVEESAIHRRPGERKAAVASPSVTPASTPTATTRRKPPTPCGYVPYLQYSALRVLRTVTAMSGGFYSLRPMTYSTQLV